MVIVFPNQEAETPAGRLVAAPIPVAPVVVKVTDGIACPKQIVGFDEAALTVFVGLIVIVPVALRAVQPPVTGIV